MLITDRQKVIADIKVSYKIWGSSYAQRLCEKALGERTITVEDYIGLVRWTEGR